MSDAQRIKLRQKKYMQIEYRGHRWRFPADRVAHNYAAHYEKKCPEEVYDENFDYIMGDDGELSEWYLNNMDWEDVAEAAVLVQTPKTPSRPPANLSESVLSIVMAN